MRSKQLNPIKMKKFQKRRLYDHQALIDAYTAVKSGTSVRKAALLHNVPQQTLRDRILGKVDPECVTTGRSPLLSLEEEANLVKHLTTMAKYGYGYSRQEVVDLASDYSVQLGRRTKANPFTLGWFRLFKKRWPEMRVCQPRSLEVARAKSASKEAVSQYFTRLSDTITRHNLTDKPHLIFNIDEKGLQPNHRPPCIVSSGDFHPQAVTSGKGDTTTILGCVSASGMAIPPYFVFAGKRINNELLKGCTPGADATMSDSGWSNSNVFRQYLKNHFMKFVPSRDPDQHILLLLDGHKSHLPVDILEWAKENKIILFILPAHTSHILQPLDVSCYGPLQRIFNNEAHKYTRESCENVSRYSICALGCRAYMRALTFENITSGFRKCGIFPLNSSAVSTDSLKPAEVFSVTEVEGPSSESDFPEKFMQEAEFKLIERKSGEELKKKKRNTIGKIVSGREITEDSVLEQVKQHQLKAGTSTHKRKQEEPKISKRPKVSKKHIDSPVPGPSCIRVDNDTDSYANPVTDTSDDDDDKCCVCGKFTPDDVRKSLSVIFVKWVECCRPGCGHWVHLKFCTNISVVRRGDEYFCPHCVDNMS